MILIEFTGSMIPFTELVGTPGVPASAMHLPKGAP
jgi:hypothetical protein